MNRTPRLSFWKNDYLLILLAAALVIPFSLAQAENNLPPGDRPPLTVVERVEEAGTAKDFEGSDYIIVLDHTINRFRTLGVTYVDGHMIYKVLTEDGCKDMSVIKWGFDPQSQYIDVQEVNIIRGKEVIPVDVSVVQELPAPQRAIYWSDRVKLLQLPRLQVNDGIEIKTFRKGFTYALLGEGSDATAGSDAPDDDSFIPPMPDQYFDIVLFSGSVPVVEKKYVLTLPPTKRLHSEIYNGTLYAKTTYNADSTIYAWWAKDVPKWKSEPRTPDLSDMVPKVVMATVESWEAKSRWFFDVNDKDNQQFAYTPEIEQKVVEILDEAGVSKKDEDTKAKALLHWVAQNIRYSGQTMGKGEGFTIHSGTMIYEQRSGVCKDIAGMLITMMRAAGMDAYAAMTMAGSRIDAVPADQFNHCVTALKKEDGSFVMYDPTWVPYNNDIWSKLETEQHYLVGTPEGETLSKIEYSPPEESPLRIKHDAKLLPDGTLEGKFTLNGSGALDSRLRRFLTHNRYPEVSEYLEGVLHAISDRVELLDFDHRKGNSFDGDMYWNISYRIPEYAEDVDGALEFQSPMMLLTRDHPLMFRAGAMTWAEERSSDVFLYYTQLLDGTETIKLPRGFKVNNPPESEEVDELYASFKGKVEMKKSKFILHQEAQVKRRQIPPSGYDGFRKAMVECREYAGTVFRAEKGGAK